MIFLNVSTCRGKGGLRFNVGGRRGELMLMLYSFLLFSIRSFMKFIFIIIAQFSTLLTLQPQLGCNF